MLSKIINFLKTHWIIVSITFLAAILRFVAIDRMPPSLNWDEVSHGYNAYSILKTGKDEWGFTLPSIFRAYGDYKLPVYIYLTAISEFFFGLNTFAVRLPSVLAGIGIVIFTYLLVKELFKDRGNTLNLTRNSAETVALVSSLLVAVEPWSLFLSRGAFEANLALFFIVAGVYFFLRGLHTSYQRTWPSSAYFLLLTSLFLGLSVWTYNSARIFVPLLIILLIFLFKKELFRIFKENRKLTSYILLLTSIFFLPMFYQLLKPFGQARYGEVAIIDQGAIAQIIEARQKSSLNPLITRFIYNRPMFFTQRFISNWASHFTCSFLFFKGGSHYQFSVPDQGLLYLVNLPFFFWGLVLLLIRAAKRDRVSILLLSWLFLAPIPSSLTREAPHVLRSIAILPMPMIISAIGFATFVNWSEKFIGRRILERYGFKGFPRKKVLYLVYISVLVVLANNYLTKYFGEYKKNYSWSWQYGYKEVVDYVKQNYNKYDKIIVTKKYGEPHEFLLFYGGAGAPAPWPWNPVEYQSDPNLNRFYQSSWYWVDRFDRFYFINDWDIPKEEWQPFVLENGVEFQCEVIPDELKPYVEYDSERCLLITSPNNMPKGWSKLETIYFLDGEVAFEIYLN